MPVQTTIQLRRGTAAQWTAANPILSAGEPGYETDSGKQKVGDGATAWAALPYLGAAANDSRLANAYLNLGQEASDAVDSRLAGKVPGANVNLFAGADYAGGTAFTRNPGLFCADLDWTFFSPWNSTEGPYQGGSAITPRHALLADHFSDPVLGTPPMSIGTVLAFVDDNNVVVKRTITAFNRIGTTDLLIATLDSDLPASIRPAAVLPGNLPAAWFPAGTAVLCADKDKLIHVAEISGFASADIAPAAAPNRAPWTTPGPGVGGDSGSPVVLVLDGQVVLWFLFHTEIGGGDLPGSYVSQINAVLAQAGSYALTVAPLNALGSAAFASVGQAVGQVPAVQPNGFLPPAVIPVSGTNGAPINADAGHITSDGNGALTAQSLTLKTGLVAAGGCALDVTFLEGPGGDYDISAGTDGAGNMTVQSLSVAVKSALPATVPSQPTIIFAAGHFYGSVGGLWKQLDN